MTFSATFIAIDQRCQLDFIGFGNILNCKHSCIHCYRHLSCIALILGVDDSRFDLASIIVRGDNNIPRANPPLLWVIESSRILFSSRR